MVECQISNRFDPSFFYFYFLLSQLGMGPCFYSAFRQVSLRSQARKEFLESRGGIGKSLNWRICLLFPLSLLLLHPRT